MNKFYLLSMATLWLSACTGPTTYYTYFPNPSNRLRATAATPKIVNLKVSAENEKKSLSAFGGAQSGHGWVDDGNISQATIVYGGMRANLPGVSLLAAPFGYLGSATKEQKPGLGLFLSAALNPVKDAKWSVAPQVTFAYAHSGYSDSGCDSKQVTAGVETCSNISIHYERAVDVTAREGGLLLSVINQLDSESELTLTPGAHFASVESRNRFNLFSADDFTRGVQGWNFSFLAHYSRKLSAESPLHWAAGLGVSWVRTFRPGDSIRSRKWMPMLDGGVQF